MEDTRLSVPFSRKVWLFLVGEEFKYNIKNLYLTNIIIQLIILIAT